MSDFIARMAARAVGEAPLAQPRLPALFEEPGPGWSSGLEVVEDEVVARAPLALPREPGRRASAPSQEPAAPRGSAVEGSAVADAPMRPPTRREARRVARPAPEPPQAAERDAASLGASVDVREAIAPPQPSVSRPVEGVLAAAGPPALAVAAAAARPAPAVPTVLTAPPVQSSRSAAAPDQPTVSIRIGRLEVRANLREEQPAQPQPREPVPADGLSLSDYLRGERALL